MVCFATFLEYGIHEMTDNPQYIYKILTQEQWALIQKNGLNYQNGSELDQKDGYLHLSTATQVERVARKYFASLENGIILQIDYSKVEDLVKWEPNSSGELFPHIYGNASMDAVAKASFFKPDDFDYEGLSV